MVGNSSLELFFLLFLAKYLAIILLSFIFQQTKFIQNYFYNHSVFFITRINFCLRRKEQVCCNNFCRLNQAIFQVNLSIQEKYYYFNFQMKEQFQIDIFSISNLKKLSTKPSKKELKMMIQSLIKKRQQHQARIDKLITRIHSQDNTHQSHKNQDEQFSKILRQLQNSDNLAKQESKISVEAFSNHVNLLATVSLKTQYFLYESQHQKVKTVGKLIQSLKSIFRLSEMTCVFGDSKLISNHSNYLSQTVQYLKSEQMQQGLFNKLKIDEKLQTYEYHGTRFRLGKYEQVQLSVEEVTQQQKSFVKLQTYNQDKHLNISWLLLARLINKKTVFFPETLNILFSYPIKTFKISESSQLISFNDLLGEFNKVDEQSSIQLQRIKIFGIEQKTGVAYEIQNLSKTKNIKHYTQIVHRFTKLVTVVEQQLPVKHIPLSCLQNHFVIVSLNIKNKGRYFLSVGSVVQNSQFRVYVIDSQQNVVSTDLVINGEFVFTFLKEETYEVYIHPIPKLKVTQVDLQQSFELVNDHQQNFTLWIQSHSTYSKNGDLSFQIRLKQEFNDFTSIIAKSYLRKNLDKYEHEQQLLNEQQEEIIVRRQVLTGVSLYMDTFFCGMNKFQVVYKGLNNLTDNLFKQLKARVKNNQCLYLYKNAQIESLSLINGKNLQKVKYKMMVNYL